MSDEDQRARLGVFLPQTVRSYLLGHAVEGEAFPPFRCRRVEMGALRHAAGCLPISPGPSFRFWYRVDVMFFVCVCVF